MLVTLWMMVLLLAPLVSLSPDPDRERWVWGHERSGRQIDPPLAPTFPQTGGSSLLQTSSASSLSPLRRPARTEGSFSVPSTRELDGALSQSQPQASSLSQSHISLSQPQAQAPLVIRPLPIDISTLPLETSDSSDALDTHGRLFEPTLQHQFPQDLGNADLQSNSRDQFSVLDFSRPHVDPSHSRFSRDQHAQQAGGGHLEALVSTPDISQLPLQSSSSPLASASLSSSSFSPSSSSFASPPFPSSSFLSPAFPSSASSSSSAGTSSYSFVFPSNALPVESDVLFPQKIEASNIRPGPQPVPLPLPTTPPPSSTPQPVQVFLPRLDNSDILDGDGEQERQLFKALEALQKESLALDSRQLDLAFQRLSNQLAAGANDIPDGVSDSLVFPILPKDPAFGDRNPSSANQNSHFKRFFEVSSGSPVFTFPLLQQDSPQHLQFKPLGPYLHRRTQPIGVRIGRSESSSRKERRSPSYMWVWPEN